MHVPYVPMYVLMVALMDRLMYARMYVHMCLCMYVCAEVWICMYIYIYTGANCMHTCLLYNNKTCMLRGEPVNSGRLGNHAPANDELNRLNTACGMDINIVIGGQVVSLNFHVREPFLVSGHGTYNNEMD